MIEARFFASTTSREVVRHNHDKIDGMIVERLAAGGQGSKRLVPDREARLISSGRRFGFFGCVGRTSAS